MVRSNLRRLFQPTTLLRRHSHHQAGGSSKRNVVGMTATVGGLVAGVVVYGENQKQQQQSTAPKNPLFNLPNMAQCNSNAYMPLFQFGAMADVQYADVDDAYNFSKTQKRRYRNSLEVVKLAAADWNSKINDLSFVVHLGDVIDQQCFKKKESQVSLDRVLDAFKLKKELPFIYLIGNHELYNFSRSELKQLLDKSPYSKSNAYYSFKPKPDQKWKIVVLDSYAINCIDHIDKNDVKEEAYSILEKNNPNDMRGRGKVNWLEGLSGTEKRFVPYNGSIGETQLKWLHSELKEADANNEKVILMAHVPIAPGSCVDCCLSWDYEEVLAEIESHKSVFAVMVGHDHSGGYEYRKGIHHLTFPSPLQATEELPQAHSTVQVYDNCIVMQNSGVVAKTFGGDIVQLPYRQEMVATNFATAKTAKL